MTAAASRLRSGRPGLVDTLNMRELHLGDASLGIPMLECETYDLPEKFVRWPNRKRAAAGDGLHFFIDDYRFEPVWNNVDRYLKHFKDRVVVSPDFSMYYDWPLIAQIWQVYRARWIVSALRDRGVACIPSVSWAGPDSLPYAFAGLPVGGDVAISAYGAHQHPAFRVGYEKLLEVVQPRRVLIIGGESPEWLRGLKYEVRHGW